MNPNNLVEPFDDPTGQMSELEIANQNISNLMDAVNGLQSQVGNILQTPTATIVNDGSTNRAVVGYQPALGLWGIFASKVGKDALNTTNLSDLTLDSNQDMFKIVTASTATIPTAGGNIATVSVPHGLSFTPAFLSFVLVSGNWNVVPTIAFNQTSGIVLVVYSAWSDSVNINFQVQIQGAGPISSTTQVKYYLLQETAN